jgi:hypothetical protein
MQTHEDRNMPEEKPVPVQTKRPYQSPVLVEYGDIHQVTQGSNPGGKIDGGPAKT